MTARDRLLVKLRKQLRRRRPLPKDGWVERRYTAGRMHSFQERDRKDERAILKALSSRKATPDEHDQALEIAECRPGERCGSWVCYVCRHLHWKRERRHLGRSAQGLSRNEISFLTIVIGGTINGYLEVESMILEARENLFSALGRWPDVEARGRFEIDYYRQNAIIPKEKAKTLRCLNMDVDHGIPILVPHMHVVVLHPGIRRGVIRWRLQRLFPGHRRVRIDPLHGKKPLEDNLDAVARYPLKFELPGPKRRASPTGELRYVHRMIEALGGLDGILHINHCV